MPDVSASDYGVARRRRVGVMLVGFAEGLGAAKTYATRDHYEMDANRELIGLGGATSGPASRAAWSSTAACPRRRSTRRRGAKTQLSGLVAAAADVVTLLFLTGLFE